MDKNSVRLSYNDEAIGIINSNGVAERIKVKAERIENGTPYIVNERMLLILMDLGNDMVEAHIAQPREYWPSIHTDIDAAISFIVSQGYKEIYTNVTKNLKTTINLLIKHKFKAIDTVQSEVILKWA